MSLTRLQWLWERYDQSQTHHVLHFLKPPPQNFTREILWLTQRYVTILPKIKLKKHNPNNNHQTFHPSTLQALIETHNITHLYYSSPLTCPITITPYDSPHNRDIIFRSTGLAHSSKWTCNGLNHPPYLKICHDINPLGPHGNPRNPQHHNHHDQSKREPPPHHICRYI
jgi:hypothetical protein